MRGFSALVRPSARVLHRICLSTLLGLGLAEISAAQTDPGQPQADASAPLPELHSFVESIRGNLHSDEALLDQYTFTEKHTEKRLDGKGGVKKTTTETFEVYPSLEPGHTYRRLVEKDGHPLTSQELAEEDRKHEKKVGDPDDPATGQKQAEKRDRARRKEASA